MNPFALAYREQQQLFLFDKTYILGTLLKVGGLSTLLARFIVQFFWNKTAALGITLALLALSSFLTFGRDTSRPYLSHCHSVMLRSLGILSLDSHGPAISVFDR